MGRILPGTLDQGGKTKALKNVGGLIAGQPV